MLNIIYLFKSVYLLIASLPELISLIKNMTEKIEASEKRRKLKSDFKKIDVAFKNKDIDAINDLFNS